jgi:hypothetical protein
MGKCTFLFCNLQDSDSLATLRELTSSRKTKWPEVSDLHTPKPKMS